VIQIGVLAPVQYRLFPKHSKHLLLRFPRGVYSSGQLPGLFSYTSRRDVLRSETSIRNSYVLLSSLSPLSEFIANSSLQFKLVLL
jgi:hypothetical protein